MVNRRVASMGLLGLSSLAFSARAQVPFPDRPVKLVVPYGAGTSTDILSRRLSAAAEAFLGQPVVVDNRPGAGGITGTQFVQRSAPDGLTLVMGSAQTHAINPSLYPKLPYDPVADFEPVIGLATQAMVLVVSPALGVNSVNDIVGLAKSKPGAITFASTGSGSPPHLVGEIFRREAQIEIVHVPYPGGAQALTDVMTGTVSMIFYPYQPLKPYVESGRMKALAVTATTRPEWLPGVPTMPELGFPKSVIDAWYGIYAPARTPKDRLVKLHDAYGAGLESSELKSYLAASGTSIRLRNGQELRDFTISEVQRYRPLVAASGAKVD